MYKTTEQQVKLLEKQKTRAEHLADRTDKKVVLFDMMIGYSRRRI